jgi:hypothetical protein
LSAPDTTGQSRHSFRASGVARGAVIPRSVDAALVAAAFRRLREAAIAND